MDQYCFLCKRKFVMMDDKFGKATLTDSNIAIPEGFGMEDKLCYNCFQSEEQKAYKPDQPQPIIKKKMSVRWVVLCIIPFLWIYPYWKVQKLPQGLIINSVLPLFFFGYWFFGDHNFISLSFIGASIFYVNIIPNMFFTYRWGKKWNYQIDLEMVNSKSSDSESNTENSKSQN